MLISFYGQNCFKIENKGVVLTTNPSFLDEAKNSFGSKLFRGKSDIIIYTEYPVSLLTGENSTENESLEIKMSGRYEAKDIEIKGWKDKITNFNILKSFYFLKWDNFKIAVLDNIKKEIPLEAQEDIRESDLILVSKSEKDLETAKKLNPKLIVTGGKKANFPKEKIEVSPEKFSFSKKDLGENKTRVIFLKI